MCGRGGGVGGAGGGGRGEESRFTFSYCPLCLSICPFIHYILVSCVYVCVCVCVGGGGGGMGRGRMVSNKYCFLTFIVVPVKTT